MREVVWRKQFARPNIHPFDAVVALIDEYNGGLEHEAIFIEKLSTKN
jgi:hypothetical protein